MGGGEGVGFPARVAGGGGGAAFLTTGMVALVFWGLLHLYQAAQIFIFRFKVLFFLVLYNLLKILSAASTGAGR